MQVQAGGACRATTAWRSTYLHSVLPHRHIVALSAFDSATSDMNDPAAGSTRALDIIIIQYLAIAITVLATKSLIAVTGSGTPILCHIPDRDVAMRKCDFGE